MNGGEVDVRRIRPDEGATLRDLRLRSLADAPEAFGQPLEEAVALPDGEWQQAARGAAFGNRRIWLFAEDGGRVVGLVQGRRRPPATLLLFSMWVDPSSRRLGVGRRLIETLEGWAWAWRSEETVLWVYEGNEAAIAFYRALGFEVILAGEDADAGARFGAIAMRRPHDPHRGSEKVT